MRLKIVCGILLILLTVGLLSPGWSTEKRLDMDPMSLNTVHLQSIEYDASTFNLGIMAFNGVTGSLPRDVSVASGTYTATWWSTSDMELHYLDHWEASGGVTVSPPTYDDPTYGVTVSGSGTLTAVYKNEPQPRYTITFVATCVFEDYVSVQITKDGEPTGSVTPCIFPALRGTHTFEVPSTDPSGHPFSHWDTGETTTTIITYEREAEYVLMHWAYYGEAPSSEHTLTVSSDHDSPVPGNGPHTCIDGQSVTCSVTSPVTEGGTVWACTGWSGTGSVPSTGTGKTVTFTITQDSSITWNWQVSPPSTYDAVIKAHCNTEGLDISVPITKDGSPTGFSTPHTFSGLSSTHMFTVPSSDTNAHPFLQWSTFHATATIIVSSGGSYTAYYHAGAGAGRPVLISPLEIAPGAPYFVGDTLTAKFTVRNDGNAAITLDKLLLGGRFNDGELPGGGFPDFTFQTVTLQQGQTHAYEGTLSLTEAGNYHFFIAYYMANPTAEEKKLLDVNNWNPCIDLAEGLADQDRTEEISAHALASGDIYWLAKTIMSEAGAYPALAQTAVGWTILNRLDSGYYASEIEEIVKRWYATNQEPTETMLELARRLLKREVVDPTAGATHFISPQSMKPENNYGPYPVPGTSKRAYYPYHLKPRDGWQILTATLQSYVTIDYVHGPYPVQWTPIAGIDNWQFMFYRPYTNQIRATLHSPGELRVYDSLSRVTGLIDGKVLSGIPESSYYNGTVVVPFGSYRYEVACTDDGLYGLAVASVGEEGNLTFLATEIPATIHAIHQYTIDWTTLSRGGDGVNVRIDNDGNGVPESALSSNSTLTSTGFLARQHLAADLNGDSEVGLEDLVTLAQAYGSKLGDTNWNPNADIDGNGIVGLNDLVILAQNYGQHYP